MGFFDKLIELLGDRNVLYYPGCLSKYGMPEINENYKKILKKIGIDFITLSNSEVCCGSPALNAGYRKDFEKLAEKNYKIFKKHNISKIITSCPSCFHIFNSKYSEFDFWDIKTEHITKTILDNIKKITPMGNGKKITYHDPCHLGRYEGIYDAPRKILEKLGFEVVEMAHIKKDSICCGAGAGVRNNFPALAGKIAKERVKEAEETGAEMIVTTCSMCTRHIKENSKIPTFELSEVIVNGN